MVARPVDVNRQSLLLRKDKSLSTTIKRYRSAVEQLVTAYFDARPAAIVVSDGRLGRTHVLTKFLDLIDDDADVVNISGPCSNAIDFMRQVVKGISFEPNDLSLSDLEGVLDLFLQHQQKNMRRTIIAVQDFDSHGWWVLDKVRRLIESEAENKHGLMMLLSGSPTVNLVLNEPILDVISGHAGDKILLKPFTLSETRDFIRNYFLSSAALDNAPKDVGEVIDFAATNVIHDACEGIPDDVYQVCNKCLEMLPTADEKKITAALANEAIRQLGMTDLEDEASASDELSDDTIEFEPPGYLVVENGSESPQDIPVMDSSIVFGRDRHCDCCIAGLKISRFHSIFSMTPDGLDVVDLGSTNGTFVNGEKVDRFRLGEDDVVQIGQVRITYVPQPSRRSSKDVENPKCDRSDKETLYQEPPIRFAGDVLKLRSTS